MYCCCVCLLGFVLRMNTAFFPSHLFLFSILEFSRTTLTLRSTEVKVI